jgi:hypothetical protein
MPDGVSTMCRYGDTLLVADPKCYKLVFLGRSSMSVLFDHGCEPLTSKKCPIIVAINKSEFLVTVDTKSGNHILFLYFMYHDT